MIENILERLREKFKYNSEQAEIYREGSDKDAYFREKKDLYLDRANTYGEAIRIVQEVAKDGGWIPCSERLPKKYVYVLVCDREGDMYIAQMYENEIFGKIWRQWNGGELRGDWVTAWQPLPAPYQKGE